MYIFDEATDEQAQVDISQWRNQDHNENHTTHDIELLQTIVATADMMRSSKNPAAKSTVHISDLVARTARRIPAKITPQTLKHLVKFF